MARERKRHRKDRKDGYYVKRNEPGVEVLVYLSPNKLSNIVNASLTVEMAGVLEFVGDQKGAGKDVTISTTALASIVRLCAMKPHLNRFVKNRRLYMRKTMSIGYLVAARREPGSERDTVRTPVNPNCSVYDICEAVADHISRSRAGEKLGAAGLLAKLAGLPDFLKRFAAWFLMGLDRRGWIPASLMETEPGSATVFVSNLGSIGGPAVFHNMYEWGTTSMFVTLGTIRKDLRLADGVPTEVPVLDVCISVDGRIADGIYLSRSIDVLRQILSDPSCLRERYVPPKSEE